MVLNIYVGTQVQERHDGVHVSIVCGAYQGSIAILRADDNGHKCIDAVQIVFGYNR